MLRHSPVEVPRTADFLGQLSGAAVDVAPVSVLGSEAGCKRGPVHFDTRSLMHQTPKAPELFVMLTS